MDNRLAAEIRHMETSLKDAFELAMEYGSEDLQDQRIFLKLMEDLCNVSAEATVEQQALDAAKSNANSVEEFKQIYNSEKAKAQSKSTRPKQSAKYKKFQSELVEIKNSFDNPEPNTSSSAQHVESEEMVVESQINPIDPLTKQPIQNPVRNKLCGHHYEQLSVQEAIRINNHLRCPVAGCGNRQHIRKEDLVFDAEFAKRLRTLRNETDEED